MPEKEINIVSEQEPDYEKAEMDLLRDGLRRTHKERFLFLSMLIKVQATMQRATITHKAYPKHK